MKKRSVRILLLLLVFSVLLGAASPAFAAKLYMPKLQYGLDDSKLEPSPYREDVNRLKGVSLKLDAWRLPASDISFKLTIKNNSPYELRYGPMDSGLEKK